MTTVLLQANRTYGFILFAGLVLACLGPGIYFHGVYPYHLVLPFVFAAAWWSRKAMAGILALGPTRALLLFGLYNVLFDFVSVVWSVYPMSAVRHGVIESLGFAATLIVVLFVGRDARRFEQAVLAFMAVGLASTVVGIAEIATPFRWPFSKFSLFAPLLGVTASPFDLEQMRLYPETLATTPTGFYWNPNDFALYVALLLPFAVFRLAKPWTHVVQVAAVVAIAFASARLVLFVTAAAAAINMLVAYGTLRFRWMTTLLVFSAFVIIGSYELPPAVKQLNELALWHGTAKGSAVQPSSVSYRFLLLGDALQMLSAQPVTGIGAGNFQPIANKARPGLPVSDLHFYWLQFVVEKGFVSLLAAAAFLAWLLNAFTRRYRRGNEAERQYVTQFGASALVLGIGGISPSSLVYFLPMYVWLGLAVAFLNTAAVEKDPVARRR